MLAARKIIHYDALRISPYIATNSRMNDEWQIDTNVEESVCHLIAA